MNAVSMLLLCECVHTTCANIYDFIDRSTAYFMYFCWGRTLTEESTSIYLYYIFVCGRIYIKMYIQFRWHVMLIIYAWVT